jgi:hypothetical protein
MTDPLVSEFRLALDVVRDLQQDRQPFAKRVGRLRDLLLGFHRHLRAEGEAEYPGTLDEHRLAQIFDVW